MRLECYGESVAAILAPVEAYVRGLKDADAGALESAFDTSNASLVYIHDGQATYSPIAAAIPRWVDELRGMVRAEEFSPKVLGLTALSEVLCVALCEVQLQGATYRDALVLARVNDVWKIVNKTFARVA